MRNPFPYPFSLVEARQEWRGRRDKPARLVRAASAVGAKRRGLMPLPRSVHSPRKNGLASYTKQDSWDVHLVTRETSVPLERASDRLRL